MELNEEAHRRVRETILTVKRRKRRNQELTSERIEEGRAYAQRMSTNDTDNIDESYNFPKKRLEPESA